MTRLATAQMILAVTSCAISANVASAASSSTLTLMRCPTWVWKKTSLSFATTIRTRNALVSTASLFMGQREMRTITKKMYSCFGEVVCSLLPGRSHGGREGQRGERWQSWGYSQISQRLTEQWRTIGYSGALGYNVWDTQRGGLQTQPWRTGGSSPQTHEIGIKLSKISKSITMTY